MFTVIIVVHEFGHVLMGIIYKWKIDKIILLPFGALTIFHEDLNRLIKEEFLIVIMGPLFQIIFTFLGYYLGFGEVFINYSMAILTFNLLPIFPLDGSKILNILLNKITSFKKSHLLTIYISVLIILICIVKWKFNLILLLIFSFIFLKLFEEYHNHLNIFNRFLLERYSKCFNFRKSKIIKSMDLTKMKRDYKHVFYNGKKYISEHERLSKRFDFNRKVW